MSGKVPPTGLISTGVEGFDNVLGGGLTAHRLYLVEGAPGSGKTTVALQFLQEGARLGEPVLYVTLSESEDELRGVADSHGWSLEGVTIHELSPGESALNPEEQYTMFSSRARADAGPTQRRPWFDDLSSCTQVSMPLPSAAKRPVPRHRPTNTPFAFAA